MKGVVTNNKKMKDIIRGRIRYFPPVYLGEKYWILSLVSYIYRI